MSTFLWRQVPLLAALACVACGTAAPPSMSPNNCIAGQSVVCACPSGARGSQVCLPSGSFGACSCADSGTPSDIPSAPDAPAPDAPAPDAPAPDAPAPDAPAPDASAPDVSAPDASRGPMNDTVAGATPIDLAMPVVRVRGTTVGARPDADCGNGGDVYYRFTLTRREVVSFDTFGSAYDTTLALTGTDGRALSGRCIDDSCAGLQSQLTTPLEAGTYLLAVGGALSATGEFTLTVRHLPAGGGAVRPLPGLLPPATVTGTTAGVGTLDPSCVSSSGPEDTWFIATCPSFVPAPVSFSTCRTSGWDTVLEYRTTNPSALTACNDDLCGSSSRVTPTIVPGADLHLVYVDGYNASASGAYTLDLSAPGAVADAGPPDVLVCTGTQRECSGRCVDVQTDPANCGACGNACGPELLCAAGACVPRCNLAGPWGSPTVVSGVNTAASDFSPTLTADELTMYFASERPGSASGDIYVARRSSRTAAFGSPTLVAELNTSTGDGHPAITGDGRTIFFQSQRMGNERLFVATRSNPALPFGPVQYLSSIRGSDLDDGVPFVSLRGDRLFWLKGGFGAYDLYTAPVTGDTNVGTPVAVTELNTPGQDGGLIVSADGLTAFWNTDRTGRLQIWTATRSSTTAAFTGIRQVSELASTGTDGPDWLSPDQCRMYFTSNRPGTTGSFDIWVSERPPRSPAP